MSLKTVLTEKIHTPKILKDRRGEPELGTVIGIVIAIIVTAVLFPVAMQQVVSANTSGWNSAVAVTFAVLLPVLAIIAIALLFVRAIRAR
jgi:uncharacterized membrane protein